MIPIPLRIVEILKRVTDPRKTWKVKHSLTEILLMTILAVTAGANSSGEIYVFARNREEWLRRFMELPHGLPSRLTIERVLRILKPKALQQAFLEVMNQIQSVQEGAVVALDGKACFHPRDGQGAKGVITMVGAWCSELGLELGQVQTGEKSNEITAIPELLDLLDIKGATVTLDAMGCQKKIVQHIVKKNKANYVIGLKSNHKVLYQEMKEYATYCLHDKTSTEPYFQHFTRDIGHGRIEHRTYTLFPDLS